MNGCVADSITGSINNQVIHDSSEKEDKENEDAQLRTEKESTLKSILKTSSLKWSRKPERINGIICSSYSFKGKCSLLSLGMCNLRHPRGVCFNFKRFGKCRKNEGCSFRHPLEFKTERYSSYSKHFLERGQPRPTRWKWKPKNGPVSQLRSCPPPPCHQPYQMSCQLWQQHTRHRRPRLIHSSSLNQSGRQLPAVPQLS